MLRQQPFMRDDTFLGVCQALGEDFRIPPNLLRIAIAPFIVWNPLLTVSIYAALGLVIAVVHAVFPHPARNEAVADAPCPPAESEDEAPVFAEAA